MTCPYGYTASGPEAVKAVLASGDFTIRRPEKRYDGDALIRHIDHLLNTDGEQYKAMRKAVEPWFSPARMRALRPMVESVVDWAIDELKAYQEWSSTWVTNLVNWYTQRVPRAVMQRFLNIPAEVTYRFGSLISKATSNSGLTDDEIAKIIGLATKSVNRTGGITDAIADLEDPESMIIFLMGAGYETTSVVLSEAVIRYAEDRTLTAREMIEAIAPTKFAMPRTALRDVDPYREGDVVFASLAGSCVPFGYGQHRCLGSVLATIEVEVAIPRLFEAFPALRIREVERNRESFHLPAPSSIFATL